MILLFMWQQVEQSEKYFRVNTAWYYRVKSKGSYAVTLEMYDMRSRDRKLCA
jgi:hypothetical protein